MVNESSVVMHKARTGSDGEGDITIALRESIEAICEEVGWTKLGTWKLL